MSLSHIMRGKGAPRNSTTSVLVLEKAIDLLAAIAADGGVSSLTALAAQAELAPATAHRIANTLHQQGVLARVGRGRFVPGYRLLTLADASTRNRLLTLLGTPI